MYVIRSQQLAVAMAKREMRRREIDRLRSVGRLTDKREAQFPSSQLTRKDSRPGKREMRCVPTQLGDTSWRLESTNESPSPLLTSKVLQVRPASQSNQWGNNIQPPQPLSITTCG